MKSNTIRKNSQRVRQLDVEARRIADLFFETKPIIVGTLSEVKRRCGNPSCHCATGQGHPAWTLLTKYKGKRRCQVVRRADVDSVAAKVPRYQQLRKSLRRLKNIDAARYRLVKEIIEARNKPYQ